MFCVCCFAIFKKILRKNSSTNRIAFLRFWECMENSTSWMIFFQCERSIIIAKISWTTFHIVRISFLLVYFAFQWTTSRQISRLIQTAVLNANFSFFFDVSIILSNVFFDFQMIQFYNHWFNCGRKGVDFKILVSFKKQRKKNIHKLTK